jgi:predicted Zn-dependent protease
LAQRRGRADLASQHYRQALEVDPGFAASRANLARLLFDAGQYWHAKRHFEKLVQVVPMDPSVHAALAETLIRLGRIFEAERIVDGQSQRFPDSVELRVLRARTELRHGRSERAVALLLPLARRDSPARVLALSWLAVAELTRGRPRHAVGAAKAALELDGEAPVARYALATALGRLDHPRARHWLVPAPQK